MASLIPGYEYDIFISYRQKDNKGDRWVSEFVEALNIELESTFKEEISVYFDINPHDGLHETHDVDDSLKEKLNCLVFIPIISRTYCDPKSFAWEHEFKAFFEQASHDRFGLKIKLPNGNYTSRILPVRIHELDTEDIKCFEGITGGVMRTLDFVFKTAAGVNRPLKSNEDHPGDNINKTYYQDQINKVALAVREIITAMTKNIMPPEKAEFEVTRQIPVRQKKRKNTIIAGLVSTILLVVMSLLVIPKLFLPHERIEKSIAILPFINDSPDEENGYFINGIMEETLINLQRIRDLRVVSRNSVEQFRSDTRPSTPMIAKKLGVNYIVEGSGQKYGNTIRLRIQLIEAETDRHLWAESYEQELKETRDIFSIQSQIARDIAAELKAIITPEENQLLADIPTTDITAYDLYQRGREEHFRYWNNNNLIEALGKAEDYYTQALKFDKEFALAYIGLARVYWNKHFNSEYFAENFLDSVLILTDIALTFDKKTDEGYILKGDYYRLKGNGEKALEEYDKALKINPNAWEAYRGKADVYANDDPVRILENLYKAASLNRGLELPGLLRGIAGAYFHAGYLAVAKKYVIEAFDLDGDSTRYYLQLGHAESILGNYEKSIKFYEKIDAQNTWSVYLSLGNSYSYSGQYKEALKYYQKYIEKLNQFSSLNMNNMQRIGYAYWKNGYKKEADYYFDKQMEYCNSLIKSDRPYAQKFYTFYDRAGLYAFRGDKSKAYEDLMVFNQRKSFGLWMVTLIKNDPMFNSIRNDEEFQRITRDVEAKYQSEHERVGRWMEEQGLLR